MILALMALVLTITILVVGWILFSRSERHRGETVYRRASIEEAADRFENAAFLYAVARSTGYQASKCEERIKTLWSNHGPFDFDSKRPEVIDEYCRFESCGEGYFETIVGDIEILIRRSESERRT
jgi:hypothetical protein